MFAGVESVGYFAVAARIPDALQLLGDSYFRVYFPSITSMISSRRQHDVNLMMERSVRLISFTAGLAAVVAAAFGHEIMVVVFGQQYSTVVTVFVLMMLALHMSLTVNVLGYTLTAAGQPGRSLGVDVVRSAVSGALAVMLVPFLGVAGAALSLVLGSYVSYPVAVRLVRTSYAQAGIDGRLHVRQTLLVLGCALVLLVVTPAEPIIAGVLKLGVVSSFLVLTAVMGNISLNDLALTFVSAPRGARLSSEETG
jgi:O-antigen/teichoic acid export membrane protein